MTHLASTALTFREAGRNVALSERALRHALAALQAKKAE